MAVVNKFNVNKQQVTLDPDIIENMSANDVPYDSSFQYDENTVGDKLSELKSEVIYDVTANKDGITFASLSELLSSENLSNLIPSTVRCGGMSIRFVQSSDNKYVQYRLMADEWSVDINDWSFCGDDVLIENPEFMKVFTDSEGKILWAIKYDGGIYYGADVPMQIHDLINSLEGTTAEKIALIESELQRLEDDKVDKEEGKSLINVEYAEGVTYEENPEFTEVKLDANGKILSYRKPDGTLVENKGIETPFIKPDKIYFPESVIEDITEIANDVVDEKAQTKEKKYYLPKYGTVNIKEETFYLDAGDWSSYADDVVLIQMYDDTTLNASKRLTLSTFYIKGTLTPLAGGGYDRTSVNENSVALELHAGKDVVAIGDKFFATAIYTPVISNGYIINYTKNKAKKVTDQISSEVIGYTYDGRSTEVKQVKDIPPYRAWKVYKDIEHYCLADIDFGFFYKTKATKPAFVGIKYQGSGSTAYRQRGLRITFYKDGNYNKKDKIKIGEMVRLSGFNMKSYFGDSTRIKDPILSNLFMEIWESRGKECYPWNAYSVPFNGATGMIKSFPIGTWFGEECFGLQLFSLKKDGKNYMLDGDHDASGIFVSGDINSSDMWVNASPRDWEDEFDADDKVPAYSDLPGGRESVSVDTAAAMEVLFAFINNRLYRDDDESHTLYHGNYLVYFDANGHYYEYSEVKFDADEEEILVKADDSIVIDKVYRKRSLNRVPIESSVKVTPIANNQYEDENHNIYEADEVMEISRVYYVIGTLGYEIGKNAVETHLIWFNPDNTPEFMDVESWIDYYICIQTFLMTDSIYHNMILYTGPDKRKFYTFFYDLDNALGTSRPYDSDLIEVCRDQGIGVDPVIHLDTSFWEHFIDKYKDPIINRYAELRKDILTIDNIRNLYLSYTQGIPSSIIQAEKDRWNTTADPKNFESLLEYINNRLNWLDSTYFNL